MKSPLRQPPPSAKGKRGRGWRLRLTSTHITAVLGIFTSVPIPAAAGTTTPGSAHGDKLTRQTLRPSSSQPGTQTAGQTNFLFSKACYYHTDTMAFPKFIREVCPEQIWGRARRIKQPPMGIRPPHTPGHIPSLLRTPLGRGTESLAATQPVYTVAAIAKPRCVCKWNRSWGDELLP